jgi:hypothetical protein
LEHLEARGIEVSTLLTEIPSLSELSLHDALQYYGPNVDNESLISSILGDNLFPKLQKITCDIDVANCLIDVLGKRSKLAQVSPQLHTNIRTITIDRTSRGTSRTLKAGTRKLRALGIDVVFLDE